MKCFVQASPDCTEWSPAMTCRPRDIPKATRLVQRTLEILEYFRAPFWMENPGGAALLHKQEFMQPWEFCRTQVAYCLFGMPYRKLTSSMHKKTQLAIIKVRMTRSNHG